MAEKGFLFRDKATCNYCCNVKPLQLQCINVTIQIKCHAFEHVYFVNTIGSVLCVIEANIDLELETIDAIDGAEHALQ